MAELFGFSYPSQGGMLNPLSAAESGMLNPLTATALMPSMFDPAAAHAMMMMMPPPPSSAEVAAQRGSKGGRPSSKR